MESTHRHHVTMVAAVALAALPLTAFGEQPAGVSPGAGDRMPAIEGRCPSFSWVEAPDAAFYELVVYQLAANVELASSAGLDLERATEVLYTRVPGGAGVWTPALDQCLAPGGRYAWFVRAVPDPDTGDASEWSEPLLFANTSGAGGAVHWDNLGAVPAGFADGVDDDTTYTPGPGLLISGDQILLDPAAFSRRISVLDSADDVGQSTSIATGADGLGLVSYYDSTNDDLNVLHLPFGL